MSISVSVKPVLIHKIIKIYHSVVSGRKLIQNNGVDHCDQHVCLESCMVITVHFRIILWCDRFGFVCPTWMMKGQIQ